MTLVLKKLSILAWVEVSAILCGLIMIVAPLFLIGDVFEPVDKEFSETVNISVDYGYCETPNEVMISTEKWSESSLGIRVEVINWQGFNEACRTFGVTVNRPASSVYYDAKIVEEDTTELIELDAWFTDDEYSSIDFSIYDTPNFDGEFSFYIPNALRPVPLGYQILLSFGASGQSDQIKSPRFVSLMINSNERPDFTVPEIYAFDARRSRTELTFDMSGGEETDIYTDLFVSIIDPEFQASREQKLIWFSAVLGTGIGMFVTALLALLKDLLQIAKRPPAHSAGPAKSGKGRNDD